MMSPPNPAPRDPWSVEVRPATAADFEGILALQAGSLRHALEDLREGFLTIEHTREQLAQLNRPVAHTVATAGGELVGYALSMAPEHRRALPQLVPMFEQFEAHSWRGQPIRELVYTAMGQVCVAPTARGRGVFRKLYAGWFAAQGERYELGLTEIDASNARSLGAHSAIGFKPFGRHHQDGQEWVLVGRPLVNVHLTTE